MTMHSTEILALHIKSYKLSTNFQLSAQKTYKTKQYLTNIHTHLHVYNICILFISGKWSKPRITTIIISLLLVTDERGVVITKKRISEREFERVQFARTTLVFCYCLD